jgi:hypothetical protein
LYRSGRTLPENTSHRHLSTSRPNGKNAIFSSALAIWRLSVTLSFLTTVSRRPFSLRYAGVIESTTVSPMASWKPSFAPPWNRTGDL